MDNKGNKYSKKYSFITTESEYKYLRYGQKTYKNYLEAK